MLQGFRRSATVLFLHPNHTGSFVCAPAKDCSPLMAARSTREDAEVSVSDSILTKHSGEMFPKWITHQLLEWEKRSLHQFWASFGSNTQRASGSGFWWWSWRGLDRGRALVWVSPAFVRVCCREGRGLSSMPNAFTFGKINRRFFFA